MSVPQIRLQYDPTTFEITGAMFPIVMMDKLGKGKKVLRTRHVYTASWLSYVSRPSH